jgi:hypothetical protein
MIKDFLEDVIKELDIKMYFIKIQFYIAKGFSFIAKSIYSVFFYKQTEKKQYEEDELFI